MRSRVFAAVEAIANVAFIASLAVAGAAGGGDRPAAPATASAAVIFDLSARSLLAPAVLRAGGALRMADANIPQRVEDGGMSSSWCAG